MSFYPVFLFCGLSTCRNEGITYFFPQKENTTLKRKEGPRENQFLNAKILHYDVTFIPSHPISVVCRNSRLHLTFLLYVLI